MKVKHLVLLVLGFLILVPLILNVLFPRVELYLAEKNITEGNEKEKQEILELLNTTKIESKKWEIIQKYMIEDGLSRQFDIYISPSFTMGGSPIDDSTIYFTSDEKIPFLKEYIKEAPVDGYLHSAAMVLSSIFQSEGEVEKAKRVLHDTSHRFTAQDSYFREELLIERIRIAKNYREFDEANQYIEELLDSLDESHHDIIAQIAQLKAEIILQQGDIEKALVEVEKAIKNYEEKYQEDIEEVPDSEKDNFPSIENHVYYQSLKTLERSLKVSNNTGKPVSISGKVVRSDGTPMRGVGVFLRDKQNANRSVSPEDSFQVITDSEGRYVFNGVIPKDYQITLGFYYSQISGWNWSVNMDEWIAVDGSKNITYNIVLQKLIKIREPVNEKIIKDKIVHFEWEAVEGASYYNIGFGFDIEGGSIGTGSINRISSTEIDIPIDDIYNINGGISIDEEGVVDPVSLLAYTNPENRFNWNVSAFDEDGNLITKSNGYRLDDKSIGDLPFFYLKERELTNADKLLLDNQKDEALKEYIINYENDSNDLHSLRMITRLIGVEDVGYGKKEDEKVVSYLEDLAIKSPSESTLFRLMHYYYDENKWEDFQKWFDKYIDIVKELNEYTQSIYASALMKQGYHEDADHEFKEAMKKDGSNRFVGHWIANELYRKGLTEYVTQIAKDNPFHSYSGNEANWLVILNNCIEESKSFSDYEKELTKVLEIFFAGDTEELDNWLAYTNKPQMKKLIEAIKSVK
ncbi:hypothetical protein [Ornithinibacillus sp. 179-J 7C1 HS]|uniref:hypothetical protein n=1 Tax=Ornithinibacillus sp. 179-J 7C1 HS TaxID=3142384 RepID=UPI0039A072B5